MKKVLFLVLVLTFASSIFAQTLPVQPKPLDLTQYGVKIEPDSRLIIVMAALETAGIETSLNEKGNDFRKKIAEDLKNTDPAVLEKMQFFLKSYKQRHPTATAAELTAPFISLAYALTPAPDLSAPARTSDLPDSLLEVLDFAALVRQFYQTSGIQAKIPEYMQMYQAEGELMRPSAKEMISATNDYLHTTPQLVLIEQIKKPDPKNKKQQIITTVEHARHFYIVPDLLASAGAVNFRNIGDDYYVIVPPNTNLRFSEARRAYLQFVLEPVVLKNAKDLMPFNEGIKKLLDERRKAGADITPDSFLAVLRSLVAAADAREREYLRVQDATDKARQKIDLAKTDEAKKAVSAKLNEQKQVFADETAIDLSEAYERGAILAFYFADQLKGLEDSGFDISSSLHDIILSLDPSKESNRLAQFADARQRGLKARDDRKNNVSKEFERAKQLKAKLDEVEVVINKKNYDEAATLLKKLLEEFDSDSSIYYTLGRVASLSAVGVDEKLRAERLENARLYYINAIFQATDSTDNALMQLCYVALGRIYEFYENNTYAVQIYQKALTYQKANPEAYNQAVDGIKRLTTPDKP